MILDLSTSDARLVLRALTRHCHQVQALANTAGEDKTGRFYSTLQVSDLQAEASRASALVRLVNARLLEDAPDENPSGS